MRQQPSTHPYINQTVTSTTTQRPGASDGGSGSGVVEGAGLVGLGAATGYVVGSVGEGAGGVAAAGAEGEGAAAGEVALWGLSLTARKSMRNGIARLVDTIQSSSRCEIGGSLVLGLKGRVWARRS